MPTRLLVSTAAVALMLAAPAAFAQHSGQASGALPQSMAPAPTPNASQQGMPNANAMSQQQTAGANGTGTAPVSAQQLSAQDRNFVKEAAIGGMAEVALGNLAQQNGQDDQVKQFGQRMVQDHTNANNELQSIAQAQGIQLPQQIDRSHQAVSDRLSKLHGNAFDHAYMADMVRDHNEDISVFRREAQSGRDPQIKQFAQKTLQVIEQHDKMAREVDHSLTATGSSQPSRR